MAYSSNWTQKLEALLQLVLLVASFREQVVVVIDKIEEIEVEVENDGGGLVKDLELHYHPSTNELSCKGLYVRDVRYKCLPDPFKCLVNSIVPFDNPPIKTVSDYIKFCHQVISGQEKREASILEIQSLKMQPLAHIIESSLQNVKVKSISYTPGPEEVRRKALIICESQKAFDLAPNFDGYFLQRDLTEAKDVRVNDVLTVVSSFKTAEDGRFTLCKKKAVLNGDREYIEFTNNEPELVATLKSHEQTKNKLLLVGTTEPKNGILNYVRRIQSQTAIEIRWMFILDESAPQFNVSIPLYTKQIEKGLMLNVFVQGTWSFPYEMKFDSTPLVCRPTSVEPEVVNSSVMSCDPVLTWEIPSTWAVSNRNEIATVYALAYHCLVIKGMAKSHDGVLVTDGCTALGQAALAVAFSRTKHVYATVGSLEEIDQILKLFPQLKKENVVLHLDSNFTLKLKEKTGDDYPNIIFNQLEGPAVRNCLHNASDFSSIFHFGQEDIEKNYKIGTYQFLKNVSFFGVNVDKIASWPRQEKEAVHKLVLAGIKNGVVDQPKQIHKVNRRSITKKTMAEDMSEKYQKLFKTEGAYLIIGDCSKSDLDIVDWMIRRGVKKIYLYNESEFSNPEYHKKIKLLNFQRKSQISLFDDDSISTLLSDIEQKAVVIDATYVVHMVMLDGEPDLSLVSKTLNTCVPHVITITRNRSYALKKHRTLVSPKLRSSVIWNEPDVNLGRGMDVITKLVRDHTLFTVDCYSKEGKTDLGARLKELVPSDVESLKMLGADVRLAPTLLELGTSGPLLSKSSREAQPIFIFPGLEGDSVESVKNWVQELKVPAFLAFTQSADNTTVAKMASDIMPSILNICNRKTYNLVGLSTGCVLAMEVAHQLEEMGKVAALLLVDNPLQLIQERIENNFEVKTVVLDAMMPLIQHKITNDLTNTDSFMEFASKTDSNIDIAINHLTNNIRAIFNYNVDSLKLKGPLTVVKTSQSSDSLPYHQICPNNHTLYFEMDHTEILQSSELTKIVNKFVILDIMAQQNIHDVLWVSFEQRLEEIRGFLTDKPYDW